MGSKITVEEKSLELALIKAAGQLGTTQEYLCHKVLKENKGFLGLFGKKIKIEAWKAFKTSAAERSTRANRSSAKQHSFRSEKIEESTSKLSAAEKDKLKEEISTYCYGLCQKMTGLDKPKMKTVLEDKKLIFNINMPELKLESARMGTKLAEAMEHLLRKMPRSFCQELPFRIFVDFNGSRKAREEELVDMAVDLSHKVYENKRPIVLNYRSSYDRKIIHMALDEDKRVYTKSIGTGPNRKLMILPAKKTPQQAHRTGYSS